MADCYYLTTQLQKSIIEVRRYRDDSVVKSYNIECKSNQIDLIHINGSLLIALSPDNSFVYSFDCFDPSSLKQCYEFNDEIRSWGLYCYNLGDNLVCASNNDESIKYRVWKFTQQGYSKINEWTLPIPWKNVEILKLSNHQLLSIRFPNDGQPNRSYYLSTPSSVQHAQGHRDDIISTRLVTGSNLDNGFRGV